MSLSRSLTCWSPAVMGKSFVLDVLCLPSNKGFKIVIRGDRYKAVERQGEACLIVGTEIGKEIVRRDH